MGKVLICTEGSAKLGCEILISLVVINLFINYFPRLDAGGVVKSAELV